MVDLFVSLEELPQEVQDILQKYYEIFDSGEYTNGYVVCANLVKELEEVGYTCSYYLDAEPFWLRKHDAQSYWEQLANVPVNEDGEIEEQFYDFDEGTDRQEIWSWLEDTFNISVAKDLMKIN